MSSEAHLWPSGEANNQFVYYLTGGFTVIYMMCILVTYAGRRNQSNILVLPPSEDVEDENDLYKYVISIKTSRRPGNRMPSFAKIYMQLEGEKKKSKYQRINISRSGKLMFQRGGYDMLLFRTKDHIGEILEVKFVISAVKDLKWNITQIEVMDLVTKRKKRVPYCILDIENPEIDIENTVYPDEVQEGCCRRCISKPCVYHHCVSPVNLPIRFGAYTAIVNVLLIFFTCSLLMMGTLITQILTSMDNTDSFMLEIDHIIYTFVTVAGTCVFIALLEILMRKIKSGRYSYFHKPRRSNSQGDDEELPKELNMKTFQNNFNMYKDGAVSTLIPIKGHISNKMNGREVTTETPYQSYLTVIESKDVFMPVDKYHSQVSEEVMYSCTNFDDTVTNQDVNIDTFHSFIEDQPSVYHQINEEMSGRDKRQVTGHVLNERVETENLVRTEDITIEIDKEGGLITSISLDECPQIVSKIQADGCMSDTVQYLPTSTGCSRSSVYFDPKEQDDHTSSDEDDRQVIKSEDTSSELYSHYSDTLIPKTYHHFPPPERKLSSERKLPSERKLTSERKSERKTYRTQEHSESIHVKKMSSWRLRRRDKMISLMEEQRAEELQEFTRTLIKSMDTEIKSLKQLLLDGDIDYSDICQKVGKWCKEIKEQLIVHTTHKQKVASMLDGEYIQHGDSTSTQTLDCIDETCLVKPLQKPLVDDPTMALKSSNILKLSVYDVTTSQARGISMIGADLEEAAYHLVVRTDKVAFDTVHPMKERKKDETERKENLMKMHKLEDDEALMVRYYLKTVARLTFQKVREELKEKEFDSYINEFCLNMMANKKRELSILRQRHLVVWRLCLDAVNQAKEELWLEYQDPVNVYSQFLIRQTLLNKIRNFAQNDGLGSDLKDKLEISATHLKRSWKKQGFHNWKKTSVNLSEVLVMQYFEEVKKNATQKNSILVNFEHNFSAMNTLRQRLASTLEREASRCILNVTDKKFTRIVKSNQNRLDEFFDVKADIAFLRFVYGLPDMVEIMVENEILYVSAVQLVSEVTRKALQEVQLSLQMTEYQDYDVQSLDEDDISGLLSELKPVRTFLKVVTVKEEQKTKRTIQKHFEQDGLKKHEDFAMVNLQSVIDSYHIRDEDQVDDSITADFLFELEWELTQENRKPLPQFLKGPLVFLIFCATVLNLLYTTLAGAQLIVASLQEWLVCFFGSLIIFVILECIASIIVGYCDMTHIKH